MAAAAAWSSSARSGAGTSASRANPANQPRPASLADHSCSWPATVRTCRGAASSPRRAPSASEAWIPASAAGTSAIRRAITAQSSAVAAGMARNTERTECTGPKMFDSERSGSPAALRARPASSRSRSSRAHRRSSPPSPLAAAGPAAAGAAGMPGAAEPAGRAAASSASAVLASASAAAWPSGE